jgi:hypothetical protein
MLGLVGFSAKNHSVNTVVWNHNEITQVHTEHVIKAAFGCL